MSQAAGRLRRMGGCILKLVNQTWPAALVRAVDKENWIADFMYKKPCQGPVSNDQSRMSELRKPLEQTDVHLVSFSVDPEKDTAQGLRGVLAEKCKRICALGF